MSGKWTEIKNAGWVLCIGICLLAVAVGLIIASVNRYSGDSFSGSAELSAESVKDSENVTELTQGTGGGTLLTLPETSDAGQEYIDKLGDRFKDISYIVVQLKEA